MCKSLINSRFISAINMILERDNGLTKGDLSLKFGISQQKFTEILKERMNVGADLLAGLITEYPDISAEWLLTGNGSMLKTPTASEPPCNPVVTPLEDGEKGSMLDTINTQAHIIKDLTAKITTLESRLGKNEA